jgi:hypothetical protein
MIRVHRLFFGGLLALLFIPAVAWSQLPSFDQAAPPPLKVLKGKLPTDQRYWDYLKWHENHAVLSLVVSGKDKGALIDSLEKLYSLKQRKVLIGDIVIIGGNNMNVMIPFQKEESVTPLQLTEALRKMGISDRAVYEQVLRINAKRQSQQMSDSAIATKLQPGPPRAVNSKQLFKKFNLKYSPAWIVRYRGTDYVYEGSVDPRRFFAADGTFIGGNENF